MATYLGLGGSIHDFSACLLSSERSIATCEVERLTRRRYAVGEAGEHRRAVEYLLQLAGVDRSSVVVVGDDMIGNGFYPDRVVINHHDAHAASSFFQSPFSEADVLVIDGVGSSVSTAEPERRETASLYRGLGNRLRLVGRVYGEPTEIRLDARSPRIRTNSLGDFYRFFTQLIGFGFLQAGKTMGLASYGDQSLHPLVDSMIQVSEPGELKIFGDERVLAATIERFSDLDLTRGAHAVAANLASAAQYGVEKALGCLVNRLHGIGSGRNLCISGGAAQNSLALGRLPQRCSYENFFVDNAPADSGVAIGAAIIGLLTNESQENQFRIPLNPFTQPVVLEDKYALARKRGFSVGPLLLGEVAAQLARGKTVATCIGNAEFGARALGHRSLLADPRDRAMRDRINEIKGREWFRPIAPCALHEHFDEYFLTDLDCSLMQYVVPVRAEKVALIPSATQVDGTARVQRVTTKDEFLHGLLREFYGLTSIPVLLNTSFNIQGKSIAHSFDDALDDFCVSSVDGLCFETGVLWK